MSEPNFLHQIDLPAGITPDFQKARDYVANMTPTELPYCYESGMTLDQLSDCVEYNEADAQNSLIQCQQAVTAVEAIWNKANTGKSNRAIQDSFEPGSEAWEMLRPESEFAPEIASSPVRLG